MDVDKLKKWLDVAQQFQGDNFWGDIFDQPSKNGPMPPPSSYQTTQSHVHQTGNNTQTTSTADPYQKAASTGEGEQKQSDVKPKPDVDIFEMESEWIIWIDLPGVKKTDIQLNLVGRQLIIKGTAELPFPARTVIHSERLNGSFERSINMPENLAMHAEPIATFKEGVLEVRLARDQPKRHQITID